MQMGSSRAKIKKQGGSKAGGTESRGKANMVAKDAGKPAAKGEPDGQRRPNSKPNQLTIYDRYRNGGDGLIAWAEENVRIKIVPVGMSHDVWAPLSDLPDEPNPNTGRSPKFMWEKIKEVLREALVMENGVFKHNLIVFCWMRGEAKTFASILILMWKFFCFPGQQIVLCANSKEQTKFVQYDQIRNTILNSPRLLARIGNKNIQEKEIRIRNSAGNVVSFIRSISSFSGIVSNISGFGFSEIFEMKKPEFFQQIHGSIRNVINALGVIDSTVSPKDHILYTMYQLATGRTKDGNKLEGSEKIYFSYRCSRNGDYKDYWHPNNTQAQLNAYRATFILGGFERYFMNLWSAGSAKVFSTEMVQAVNFFGTRERGLEHSAVMALLKKKNNAIGYEEYMTGEGNNEIDKGEYIDKIDAELIPMEMHYSLRGDGITPDIAPCSALDRLGEILDTEWSISVGIDRAAPMKSRTAAKTIMVVLAKGLPGSLRGNERFTFSDKVPNYYYLILHVVSVLDHSLEGMKGQIQLIHDEYDGIDSCCAESWGMWDLAEWVKSKYDVPMEMIPNASYDRQRAAFTEIYNLMNTGRLKGPPSGCHGMRRDDIVSEEMDIFDHDPDRRWFGSPEKDHKSGIQDDFMYALAYAVYGSRLLTVDDFRRRRSKSFWGYRVDPVGLLGKY
ncbi:MAG: hypothetical protein RBT11_19605 [Desulfobacterales bacterium]|jgi:hypothetical protein|nr:hypothetical protein [Desulfobacterales bacterium]